MPENRNRPRKYDAVLGSQAPAPMGAVVLGGLEGVKSRLASGVVEQKVAALSEALNYGPAGLDLVIQALHDKSWKVNQAAYALLERRTEPSVKHALRAYNSHNNRDDTLVAMGRAGGVTNIDTLMQNLENDQNLATSKLVDHSLGLVQTQHGQNRIKHYLFNGTQMQRDYAALYFKRMGMKDVLSEAVRHGYIDKIQAFSK